MNMFTDNKHNKHQLYLVLIVIIVTSALVTVLFNQKNVTVAPAQAAAIPSVEVMTAQPQDLRITLPARGMVQPVKQIALLASVIGTVTYVNRNFVAGGSFNKGDILLEIDPAYLHMELQKAKAAYQQTLFHEMEVKANIEAGQSALDNSGKDIQQLSELAQGKPQLAMATSAREAALAAVNLAEKQLASTTLRAPFNGRVMTANIQEQEQVAPARPLANIYATDNYQLRIPLTQEQLALVDIPGKHQTHASTLVIRNPLTQQQWRGKLLRSEGFIAPNRLIYVIAEIIADKNSLEDIVPGSMLEAEMQSTLLEKVIAVPGSAVLNNNTVWVLSTDQHLQKKNVVIIHRDASQAYIASGINAGEQILLSQITDITDNMLAKPKINTPINTASNKDKP